MKPVGLVSNHTIIEGNKMFIDHANILHSSNYFYELLGYLFNGYFIASLTNQTSRQKEETMFFFEFLFFALGSHEILYQEPVVLRHKDRIVRHWWMCENERWPIKTEM